MIDLTNIDHVKALKSDLHATFDTPQGKNSLRFIMSIGGWTPGIWDTNETNDIIARDATRRLIGTLTTILEISPEQVVDLAKQGRR